MGSNSMAVQIKWLASKVIAVRSWVSIGPKKCPRNPVAKSSPWNISEVRMTCRCWSCHKMEMDSCLDTDQGWRHQISHPSIILRASPRFKAKTTTIFRGAWHRVSSSQDRRWQLRMAHWWQLKESMASRLIMSDFTRIVAKRLLIRRYRIRVRMIAVNFCTKVIWS